jgi:hypothetical protein
MKEQLDRNYQRAREQRAREMKAQKKQEKLENVLVTIIGLFIITVTLLLLSIQGQQAIQKCIDAGNTRTFCEKGLL